MRTLKSMVAIGMCLLMTPPPGAFASSHREAPITALDRAADITDIYAFVSYDHPDRVTLVLNVDPLLEPSNGPNWFPFDPDILYEIKVDNNFDATPDVTFQFRFQTEFRNSPLRLPNIPVAFQGQLNGRNAPPNSPPPVAPGTPVVAPAITAIDGPGSDGIAIRQTYTVTMITSKNNNKGNDKTSVQLTNANGSPLFAVPTNVGPQTMPNYNALASQGIYTLNNGIRSFAGTVADPFFIDLGAAFDTFNFRLPAAGVLTPAQDNDNQLNTTMNTLSGMNVNTITIEVPITMLTNDGALHPASNPNGTIGVWATTSRPQHTIRHAPDPAKSDGPFQQVQRFGNPLINELLIGDGSKDRWSMDEPVNDSQFQAFDFDPGVARTLNALFLIPIPAPPRNDLLPLITYAPPIAPAGTPAGPIADLMRLNTGVPPTPQALRSRKGLLGGDPAGFPNGRRLTDDAVDVFVRLVAGVWNPAFNVPPNSLLGDGVNAPDVAPQETFPYSHFAYDGRNSRHINPGEVGCGEQPTTPGGPPPTDQGGTAVCPVN